MKIFWSKVSADATVVFIISQYNVLFNVYNHACIIVQKSGTRRRLIST